MMTDPNLHNPAFIHAVLSIYCFCIAALVVAFWIEWRYQRQEAALLASRDARYHAWLAGTETGVQTANYGTIYFDGGYGQ